MNRFLLFLLITFVLISGSIVMTLNMGEGYVYEDKYAFFDTYEDDTYEGYTDLWHEEPADAYMEEGTYTDEVIEEDESGNIDAAQVEAYENDTYTGHSEDQSDAYMYDGSADVGYDDYEWDEMGPLFPYDAYDFTLVNAPEYEYDFISDFTISLYQSDFLDEIEHGNFPGIAYTIGQELGDEYWLSESIPYLKTLDSDSYYWLGDGMFGISVNNYDVLRLSGFLIPVSTTYEELVEAYGEPIINDDEGNLRYSYMTNEHYRLIFHTDPYDSSVIRFMEYY